MATSGSKTIAVTSWNDLVFSWSVTGQSIANNTSTISWSLKLVAGSSGRISSDVYKNCSVVVNGTTYTGKALINISSNTTRTLLTGTTVIKHNDDGTKTFNYSFSQEFAIYFSDTYIGTKTGSGTGTLDTIRRLSTMAITSGLLGSPQTITVTRYDTSFVHTIAYKCGSTRGNIVTNSTATSISFTPPISLAGNNTTGTKVSVTYTITTSKSNVSYGSTSVTVEYTMPLSVAPTCSISVSDLPGWKGTYGAYIKGLSVLEVTVNATPSYGAAITSYSTTANGSTYTAASFTTDVLKASGTQVITAKVKDARGRTGTANVSLTVLDYTPPSIAKLTVHRCNADGTENNQGEYVKATFTATVTSLNNKNTAMYILRYKKATETTYTSVTLTDLENVYAVTDSTYIFAAAADSSYDVELVAADNHDAATRSTSASTAFTLIHFRADGTGVAFGKLSENKNLVDFGLQVRHSGGILNEVLEKYNDLNQVVIPNTYASVNKTTGFYANCPVSSGTFVLEVMSAGAEGQLYQRLTTTFKDGAHQVYCRHYYQGTWGSWILERSDTGWLDLTLQSGISYGSEMGYLKGRLKDGVLYIKGDVKGITANWKYFALLPASLTNGLASANRFTGLYNLSYLCGFNLTSGGQLYVTSNSASSWDATKDVHVNVAICI
jgi:hypothetical protein